MQCTCDIWSGMKYPSLTVVRISCIVPTTWGQNSHWTSLKWATAVPVATLHIHSKIHTSATMKTRLLEPDTNDVSLDMDYTIVELATGLVSLANFGAWRQGD